MFPETRAVRSGFGPSSRILELAQPKTSKTVWATTPCFFTTAATYWRLSNLSPSSEKLLWGNQQPIRPVSVSALRAVPSARTQHLAKHKAGFSAWDDPPRKEEVEEEVESFFRKSQRISSNMSQYDSVVRLSTPKTRRPRSQEPRAPPSPPWAGTWHIEPKVRTAVITPRLLQLASPKRNHLDFQSGRQSVASVVSFASRTRISERLVQLSLPKVKQRNVVQGLGRPEESIWTVSRAAMSATAGPRLQLLAQPKPLSRDYIPPREPEWSHGGFGSR